MKDKNLCHKWQMIDRAWTHNDYMLITQSEEQYSLRSDLTNDQTQNQTGTYARGYYTMESVYWFQNVMKFIHEMKTNYKDKNDTI